MLGLVGLGIFSLLLGASTARAQSGVETAYGISTGGGIKPSGSATAAVFSNPANLKIAMEEARLEIRVADVQGVVGGDLLQFNHYNKTLASGRVLSRSEVDRHLDAWFGGEQRTAAAYGSLVPVSVAYQPAEGPWAAGAGVRLRGISATSLNQGILDLLLRGTGTNRTVPVNGHFSTLSTIDLAGSFSYTFRSTGLSVGISPRLVLGTGFADGTLHSTVSVAKDAITHSFDYTARAAGPASTQIFDNVNLFNANLLPDQRSFSLGVSGVGAAVDLGATYEVEPGLLVSAGVTDLGMVRWSGDPQTVTPVHNEFRFEGIGLDLNRLENEFDGDVMEYVKHQADSLARAAYEDVQRDRSAFSSGLPTAVHLNATWNEGRYTLSGGSSFGLNDGVGAVSSSPSFHLGGEARFGPVPVRGGVRVGGFQALTFAGGVGLHFSSYRFDVGASVTPSTSTLGSGARYALGLSLTTVRF